MYLVHDDFDVELMLRNRSVLVGTCFLQECRGGCAVLSRRVGLHVCGTVMGCVCIPYAVVWFRCIIGNYSVSVMMRMRLYVVGLLISRRLRSV
jgi:hypothetical protein